MPSLSEESASAIDWWRRMSSPPKSEVMKPKPCWSLYHLTVPYWRLDMVRAGEVSMSRVYRDKKGTYIERKGSW